MINFIFCFLGRLLDWDERPDIQRQKHEKVVVIKGLFKGEDLMVNFDS